MIRTRQYIFMASCLFIMGCVSEPRGASEASDTPDSKTFEDANIQAFFHQIQSICGNTYQGKQTFIQEGRDSWEHKTMIMFTRLCNDSIIEIPFHLDDDHSRTWMLINEEGRLRFRHDHRHADGSPEDLTLYGGYADSKTARPLRVEFPADEYTKEVHPRSTHAHWAFEMDKELNKLKYQLYNYGELIFEAEFDLSKPIN